jgi:hypothetical protein
MDQIVLLSSKEVAANWPTLQEHVLWPRFEEDYSIPWLQEQIAKGHLQVWSLGEGEMVVLSQVVILSNGSRVLEIIWAHGRNVEKYIDLGFEMFQRFAHFAGCKRIDIRGRIGWIRKFRKLPGVRVDHIVSCPVPAPSKGN